MVLDKLTIAINLTVLTMQKLKFIASSAIILIQFDVCEQDIITLRNKGNVNIKG